MLTACGQAVEVGYSVLVLALETPMTRLVRGDRETRLERTLHQLMESQAAGDQVPARILQ